MWAILEEKRNVVDLGNEEGAVVLRNELPLSVEWGGVEWSGVQWSGLGL